MQAACYRTCSSERMQVPQSPMGQKLKSRQGLLHRMQAVCHRACCPDRAHRCKEHRFDGMPLPPCRMFLPERLDRFDEDGETALPITMRTALELGG